MAAEPITEPGLLQALRLAEFDARYADRVLSWVRDSREAYWLAPRTAPPLSVEKVRAWAGPGRNPLMLAGPEGLDPLAYGELNVLMEKRHEYWLGHLIVDPRQRGRGLGRQLTGLLLRRAFQRYGAWRVSLVVFPENAAAIASYRAAGMFEDGYERHHFASYRRSKRLLRMVATNAPR